MTLDSFYAIVSGTCFALVGLWWGVVEFNRDWLKHAETRALAGGIYLSFLIPDVMSLIAQVSGENKIIWRATFVIAAALGIYTSRGHKLRFFKGLKLQGQQRVQGCFVA